MCCVLAAMPVLMKARRPRLKRATLFVDVIGINPFDQPAVVTLENIETRRPHASRKRVHMSDCAGWAARARRFQCALRWLIGLCRFKRHIALLRGDKMGERAFSIVHSGALLWCRDSISRRGIRRRFDRDQKVRCFPPEFYAQVVCPGCIGGRPTASGILRATISRIAETRIKHRCMPPCLWVKTNHGKRGLIVNTRITLRCPPRTSRNCESDFSSHVLH